MTTQAGCQNSPFATVTGITGSQGISILSMPSLTFAGHYCYCLFKACAQNSFHVSCTFTNFTSQPLLVTLVDRFDRVPVLDHHDPHEKSVPYVPGMYHLFSTSTTRYTRDVGAFALAQIARQRCGSPRTCWAMLKQNGHSNQIHDGFRSWIHVNKVIQSSLGSTQSPPDGNSWEVCWTNWANTAWKVPTESKVEHRMAL